MTRVSGRSRVWSWGLSCSLAACAGVDAADPARAEPDSSDGGGGSEVSTPVDASAPDAEGSVAADHPGTDDAFVDEGADTPEEQHSTDAPVDAAQRQGCIAGDFRPFRGLLHAHTSYSDGTGTPAEAFAHARDVAGVDILVITDHVEQLYLFPPLDRWGKCLRQASEQSRPGAFLADCGFEYGSGYTILAQSTGHNNVFFADGLFPAVQVNFREFYASLVACPRCVGQFNHPGDDPSQTWNNFEYHADVDERMMLFELNGGGPTWELFFHVLRAGWRVAPTLNQDNHGLDWGTRNDTRTGVFLSELSREAMREAMLARRTFASFDKNAGIRMMGDSECWMGSVLSGYADLSVDVDVSDPDEGDGFEKIELFGPEIALFETQECGGATSCHLRFALHPMGSTYVVARASQEDGDVLVSAPLWVAP